MLASLESGRPFFSLATVALCDKAVSIHRANSSGGQHAIITIDAIGCQKKVERRSLDPDICRRDDRAPFMELGFLKFGQRFRRLQFRGIDFLAKIRKSLAHSRISHLRGRWPG